MKKAQRERKKIAFFGHFDSTNFGNEGTLQAILYHLRCFEPNVEVTCICTGPEATTKTHNIKAIPIAETLVGFWSPRNSVGRVVRKVCRLASEPYGWIIGLIRLRHTDMLIIPGTGVLTDACGLLDWGPYNLLKWSLIAKLCRCQLLLVSVGAGPIYGTLGRYFVRAILSLADFRSYRDTSTMQYINSIGFSAQDDFVYPDLAFSLPDAMIPHQPKKSGRTVVGIGLMEYAAKYSVARPRQETYLNYLEVLVSFTKWLLERDYDVRLLIGDIAHDQHVKDEFKELLRKRIPEYDEKHVFDEPMCSVGDLLTQLAATDVVVATRFHNVLFALLCEKPVISISFHHKCNSLMNAIGLSAYSMDINALKADSLIDKFCDLETNGAKLKGLIRERTKEFRNVLDQQYKFIFNLLRDPAYVNRKQAFATTTCNSPPPTTAR